MPYAAFQASHVYGPAAGAAIDLSQAETIADIKAYGRANEVVTGVGSVPLAKGTRLVNSPATITGAGSVARALPKARARASATVRIGELSQDDVTGAVLEAPVEGTLSLKEAIRILLAVAAGNASGLESGLPAFLSLDGTKTRVAGTYAGGTRTVTSRDGS